jgi:hypothetical protein
VCGSTYELGDPTTWKANAINWLGSEVIFPWGNTNDYHLSTVTVISIVRFPHKVSNFDHFHVVLADGRVGRLFDDNQNGFWMGVGSTVERHEVSNNAWMSRDVAPMWQSTDVERTLKWCTRLGQL